MVSGPMESSVKKLVRRSAFDRVRRFAGGVLIAVGIATGGCAESPSSVETSIRPADCMAPAKEIAAPYAQRELGVQQCPAPDGWRLLLVSSDENTWVDLAGPGVTWSGERPIVYESPIGNFPSVGVPPTVEWRRKNGRLAALIVGVTAQNRETFQTDRTALYVIRLQPNMACVVGRAASAEEARTIADSSKGC
jgi:hypothetical protein